MQHVSELRGISDLLALAAEQAKQRAQALASQGVRPEASARHTSALWSAADELVKQQLPEAVTVRDWLYCTTEREQKCVALRSRQCAACGAGRQAACRHAVYEGCQWKLVPEGELWRLQWVLCPKFDTWLLDERLLAWGFPRRLLHATCELEPINAAVAQATVDVQLYLQKFGKAEVPGLHLTGGNGVGKTHLAVAAARDLLQRRKVRNARFWDVAHLMSLLRHGSHDEQSALLRAAMRTQLLLLDDLGAERPSEWVAEQLGIILNHRWAEGLPVIATSNTSLDVVFKDLGPRTASRWPELFRLVDIEAPDYRDRVVVEASEPGGEEGGE
jgi:DNA replication protein DnaC